MDHAKEPWTADGGKDGVVLTKADWQRAKACVNACAGIPTEQLRPGSVANALDKLDKMQNISHHKRAWELAAAALAPFLKGDTDEK